jgi:CRP-like cAMP-binding protein
MAAVQPDHMPAGPPARPSAGLTGGPAGDSPLLAQAFESGQVLLRSGKPGRLFELLSGWVSEERGLASGRRQIVRILLPGDVCGLGRRDGRMMLDVVALTPVTAAPIAGHEALSAIGEARELELVEHVVRLGQLSAVERTAHLILSLHERLSAAGLVKSGVMPMPLTQLHLADHLGMSVVHVNRTLQLLRREGLLDVRHGEATLKNPTALAAICDYRRRLDEA